jgi:hypothetical protein
VGADTAAAKPNAATIAAAPKPVAQRFFGIIGHLREFVKRILDIIL